MENGEAMTTSATAAHLLTLATTLQTAQLPEEQQVVVKALQQGLTALARTVQKTELLPEKTVVNELEIPAF